MRNLVLLLGACILLNACGTEPVTTDPVSDTPESVSPPPTSPETLMVVSSEDDLKTEQLPDKLIDLRYFPRQWVGLSEVGEEWSIPQYCDAETPAISIEVGDAGAQLFVNYGQDGESYQLKSFKQINGDDYKDGQEAEYSMVMQPSSGTGVDITAKIKVLATDRPIAIVDGLFYGESQSMTTQQAYNHFPIDAEHCYDCFDAEDCGPLEGFEKKYGFGIVVITNTYDATLNFYENPDLTSSARTIIFEDGSEKNAGEWFSPHTENLEYELLHLVCLGEESGFYRVKVNDDQALYLAANELAEYYPWHDYLAQSIGLQRKDESANPLRTYPGDDNPVVDAVLLHECLSLVSVIGDWVQIRYDTSCDESGDVPFEKAWIRWRQGAELLVHPSWIM